MKICREPFENIEVTHSGDIYFCCAHDIANSDTVTNYIGNIYKQSFEEIWYSPKAQEIRTKLLNGDYSCCDKSLCYRLSDPERYFDEKKPHFVVKPKQYPLEVKLMHDLECNVNCIFCRNHIIHNTKEETEKYDKLIDSFFIPLLKDAKLVTANAIGDSFSSRHTRKLIKKVAQTYPDIKFEILTNGIFATKSIIEDLGITNRMSTVFVSFHSATKETYNKIVLNGNFDKVMENIEYLSELHNSGALEYLFFNFVVNKYNYKEMTDFIKLARKFNATPSLWEIRNYNPELEDKYEDWAVHLPTHPEHKNLLEILKDPIFDNLASHELYPVLANLRNK